MIRIPFIERECIYGTDGAYYSLYMKRWLIGRLRLHVIYRGDGDPDPHDHPWDFWTFPLTSYFEQVYDPGSHDYEATVQVRKVRAFRVHYRPAEHLHRVLGPASARKIVTIVWTSHKKRDWGFYRWTLPREWIPWREYLWRMKPK